MRVAVNPHICRTKSLLSTYTRTEQRPMDGHREYWVSRLTIYACESQPIVLEGLQKVLGATEEIDFIGASSTLTETLDGLRRLDPDILLVDQVSGLKVVFQFLSDVKNTSPRCQPVLWVQEMAEIDCFRAL